MKKITHAHILLFFTLGLSLNSFAQLPSEIDLDNGWYLSWNDEFDYEDSQLDNNWISQNGPSGGMVICSRWRENAVVANGILELQAKKENRGGQEWTAASIWTKEKFHYGYYECKYKYAGATGTNNSFWMWTGYDIPEGEKAVELDPNEGHYPNKVNTNIHNWTDKHEDGSHDIWPEYFEMGGIEKEVAYTHKLSTPINTNKIRFSSNHGSHFHIGEFRVYAPNANGYPKDATANGADNEVDGLVNHSRATGTTFSASGNYVIDGRNTSPENVADGINLGAAASWITQKEGEKWLEISFSESKEVGCIQFTNGWLSGSTWKNLIDNYKIEYHNGHEWVEIADFNIAYGADFSEEFHTVGMLWTEDVIKYYFDGELIRTFPHDFVTAETKIYLSLALLSDGLAGAVTDAIDGTSMKVDYVRYYQYNENTSVGNTAGNKVEVFPNPASNQISFKGISPNDSISIFDATGNRLIHHDQVNESTINIASLPQGMYCYLIESQHGSKSGTFIKN